MQFVYAPGYVYTLAGLLVVIILNTLWAVAHALAAGTFNSEQLPDFLIDDVLKLVMLSAVAVAAMVQVPGGDQITVTIFSTLKFIFGGFTALFGASLLGDLKAKFVGEFGDPEAPIE